MILIKNAHLYGPEDMGIRDVLIGGGKILRIAENLPEEEAYGITVIDGTGKVLMPGLIDAHVHILGGGGEGGYHTRTPELMLTDALEGGVTTIVGCLGTDGTTRTMTNLIAKARGLEEEGITTYIYTGSYQVPVRTLMGSVMDDLILIDKVVGTGEIAVSDHRSSQPTKRRICQKSWLIPEWGESCPARPELSTFIWATARSSSPFCAMCWRKHRFRRPTCFRRISTEAVL